MVQATEAFLSQQVVDGFGVEHEDQPEKVRLYEVARRIRVQPDGQKAHKSSPPVTEGLEMAEPPRQIGSLVRLSPEEVSGLWVRRLAVFPDEIRGYQRPANERDARAKARAMDEGKVFPPILLADRDGGREIIDGQGRGLGSIISRTPLYAVTFELTEDQCEQLFADQRRARTVDANLLVLNGDLPHELYVQDILTSPNGHPWRPLVGGTRPSRSKIGPKQASELVGAYVYNQLVGSAGSVGKKLGKAQMQERWDPALADELASLILAFGTKETNPDAFRPTSLRAVVDAAVSVFRRSEADLRGQDVQRWMSHMAAFQFRNYSHIRSGIELSEALIAHWNKRLSPARKVTRKPWK